MGSVTRVLLAVLLLAPVRLAAAPPDADASGHWEGAIQAPNRSVAFEVDLGKNARGELIGTFSNPAEGENGLPLATVAVTGREVRFGDPRDPRRRRVSRHPARRRPGDGGRLHAGGRRPDGPVPADPHG